MKHHISRLSVAWADCDAAGKVFYPNFYVWFDRATEQLFKANGASFAEIERDFGVVGMPCVETGARYENPCNHGDELEIDSWVDEWGEKTFLVRHRVTHGDGRPALAGFERRAWVAAAPGSARGIRAVAVPGEVVERFADDG